MIRIYLKDLDIEEPFKITHIGSYKTRDGRKALICQINGEKAFGLSGSTATIKSWNVDGKRCKSEDSGCDIVSEWSEKDD